MSAVVLAVVALSVTWIGGVAFRILSASIALAVLYEWNRMARGAGSAVSARLLPEALSTTLGLVFAIALMVGFPATALIAIMIVSIVALAGRAAMISATQWDTAGYAYASLSGLALAMLRGSESSGLVATVFLFAVVWSTDIFAYFVGRAVGGPKLAPGISPGKTRSGAIGGALFGVSAGIAIALYAEFSHVLVLAAVAAILSVMSQAGDLFESWVKRRHGVKDSGWIIPGHGGVMDRVDGLVAAAILLFVIGAAISGPARPTISLFPI